jgi:hypothetical protein
LPSGARTIQVVLFERRESNMKLENIEDLALALTAVFSTVLGGAAVVSLAVLLGLLSQSYVLSSSYVLPLSALR